MKAGTAGAPALSVWNVSKTFAEQKALDNVAMRIERGSIHALAGPNGCGKSTLVKALAGYHRPDPGAGAEIAGRPFDLGSQQAARDAGLRFVHQNLGLIDGLTVADNFFLEADGGPLRRVARRRERETARAALEVLGFHVDPGSLLGDLAASERAAVAIARALDHFDDVPLLVLDEPTASLPGPEVGRLFEALRRIRANGTSILFISHHLEEVLSLCDEVTVLRDGRHITTTAASSLTHERLVELMLGRQLAAASRQAGEPSAGEARGRVRLAVRNLTGETVRDVDFDVAAGEIVGVAGVTGSGREEIAALLTGWLPRDGDVVVDDQVAPPGEPRGAIRLGLCGVPPNRLSQALLPDADVRVNMTVSDVRRFWSRGRVDTRAERDEVLEWIRELDVRPADPTRVIANLSGGNQQKVVMARWLRVDPAVLVLDEPTQGVDLGSKADIHRLVDEAAARGAAVVVSSTDAEELARLCSRVLVMRRGRIGSILSGSEITSDQIEQEQLLTGDGGVLATASTFGERA